MKELKENSHTKFNISDTNSTYDNLIEVVVSLLDKYAPMKKKTIRGNQNRFMNRELSKAIMKRSSLKSKYLKLKNMTNRNNYKKQRNLCVSLKKKAIKADFHKNMKNIKGNSKPFYDIIKPYLTNKGALCSDDITLLENNVLTSNENEIANIFNEYYINVIKYTTGKVPISIADDQIVEIGFDGIIDEIIERYENHPSIQRIKNMNPTGNTFSFRPVSEEEVLILLKSVDTKKAVGIDTIPPLIIKESAEVLVEPLTKLINQSIKENVFPSTAKIAAVLPFFKKDDRMLKKNYRPISILSSISKIFEKILKNQIMEYMDKLLSPYLSAYRKHYSTHHVLIRLLEEWRKALDDGYLVGAMLMDLSKAFDCIPHDLLIAKLQAYGFKNESLIHIYSYLKGRRQCVKINNIYSKFLTILAGIPQGSILGPILFNIFINDFYYFMENSSLHGFADDHSISVVSKTIESLQITLNSETDIAINWLTSNSMIANPTKFQAIVLSKSNDNIIADFHINDKVIKSTDCVVLLGVTLDDRLKFSKHIGNICRKAGGQLNALFRLSKYLSSESKKLAVNSFIHSNFNYCPLVWHFSSFDSNKKLENIYKRSLRFIHGNNYTGHVSMEINRLRTLATEIFKTMHGLNPIYMKELFKYSEHRRSDRLKFNIEVPTFKQVRFGKNSLRVLGPMLWNSLPNKAKQIETLAEFKTFIKTWGTETCPHYQKFISYYSAV